MVINWEDEGGADTACYQQYSIKLGSKIGKMSDTSVRAFDINRGVRFRKFCKMVKCGSRGTIQGAQNECYFGRSGIYGCNREGVKEKIMNHRGSLFGNRLWWYGEVDVLTRCSLETSDFGRRDWNYQFYEVGIWNGRNSGVALDSVQFPSHNIIDKQEEGFDHVSAEMGSVEEQKWKDCDSYYQVRDEEHSIIPSSNLGQGGACQDM